MKKAPVTERMKKLRSRAGLSMMALAKKMGMKGASSFQHYENPNLYKKDSLPPEIVKKLKDVLVGEGSPPITESDILDLGYILPADIEVEKIPTIQYSPNYAAPLMPIYGKAVGGTDGAFAFNGQQTGSVRTPAKLEDVPDAYAVYVSGESMEPRYFAGELLFVDPHRPPTRNCFVVVQLKAETEGDTPHGFVKQFISRDENFVHLSQYNPEKDIKIPTNQIYMVHRIVGSSED